MNFDFKDKTDLINKDISVLSFLVYNGTKKVIVMFVATSKQMKAYDRALLEEGYTIEELVDKASDAVLTYCHDYQKVVIVCGPGNNGADGLSLALKLKQVGKIVDLFSIGEQSQLSQANRYYLQQCYNESLVVTHMNEETLPLFIEKAKCGDVIIDALFGFGLHSSPPSIAREVIDEINKLYDIDILAIDIPTGLDCDTGIPYQSVVCATKTVTLTALKQAFLNEECYMYTGEIIVETLDVKPLHEQVGLAKLVSPSWVKYHLKPRVYHGHKGDYGRILHVTGCNQYRGASLLSSKASVYSGSGVVCVCSTEEVINAVSVTTPECISLIRPAIIDGALCNRYDAILIGSGLGLSSASYSYVEQVLLSSEVPIVIDGDALTIVAENKELLKQTKAPIVLTPHFGEFRRFVMASSDIEMIDLAKAFAQEYHIVLVLKGPNTIISDGQEMYRNSTANKAMATAGMGDVLAGIIVSFIGQGYSLKNASILATYLHGKCGDIIADKEYTVLPSRLIELMPQQMNEIIKKESR